MKTFRIFALGALLVLLAACGSGDSDSNANTLHRGLVSDPETLDAHKARSTQAADVLRDLGEGLLSYSATGELVPGAAESWSVSDDGLTYTFSLRQTARWSNGEPLTAKDFVFALRRLVTPATAAFYAQMLADVAGASAITSGDAAPDTLQVAAADDHTLVITLARPTPYLLSLLTHPSTFPLHAASVNEHGEGFARPGRLVSNGAYKLVDWVPGSVLTLQRNEHYWNNAATSIDEVQHHVLTQDTTELARYRAGEIHITASVPPDSFKQVQQELGDELKLAPYLGVYYYGFNLTKPPFKNNPKLRQAMSMAIDRELLVERITGRGEAPAYSWVPPGVDNYEPTTVDYAGLTQDERNDVARRLFREAGYDEDNPLTVELRYNTSDSQRKVALAVQAMWRDVLGLETELINEEFQVLLANMRDREVTQVFRASWIGDYNDAHTFLSILQPGVETNMPGYASEEYGTLMEQAAEEVDLDRRRELLEQAEGVMLADHPAMPIYFFVSKRLVSPRVQGWGDNVLDYHYSQHLSLTAAN